VPIVSSNVQWGGTIIGSSNANVRFIVEQQLHYWRPALPAPSVLQVWRPQLKSSHPKGMLLDRTNGQVSTPASSRTPMAIFDWKFKNKDRTP
jgi:hypothetical protein